MTALVYAPEVTVRIRTAADSKGKGRVIDVSEDVSTGSVTRVNQGISNANLTLLNQNRKYDGMFSPMDTVVIYLRRLRTVLKFSGYLDGVPKWSAMPGSVNLTASCSLKRLQHFLWDPGSPEGVSLLDRGWKNDEDKSRMNDGGLAARAVNVLTEVAKWPEAQIHIGRIPENWSEKISAIADEVIAESEAMRMSEIVGSGAWVNGVNPISAGSSSIEGIGPGTGEIPATSGKISMFGGPGGGAYGNMGLTGESGVNPRDPWYCAMRWPYTNPNAVAGAKAWWTNRKILVVNPKSNKAVVLRAADWGPDQSTGRVIDVSPTALKRLGAVTDSTVHIAFAPKGAALGPVTAPSSGVENIVSSAGSPTGANPVKSGWGAAGDESNIVSARAGGCSFRCHRLAKANFVGFVNDLVAILGYHPKSIGGYNDRNIAGTSTKSNHAWGAAIDIDPDRNPRYASAAGGPYALPHKGLIPLARKWGLGWGGEYHHSKDYMHFEVIGAPSPSTPAYSGGGSAGAVVIAKWKPPIHTDYRVTNRFGDAGPYQNRHTGTDFAVAEGTNIYPVGPGTVHDKGSGDPSYGNWISIDHGAKNFTFYAHMNAPSPIAVGTQVGTNTVIGHVGMTGNASGFHVHLELRQGADDYDNAVNIEKYVLGGKNRADPPAGTQAVQGDVGETALDVATVGQGLFNVFQYNLSEITELGYMLTGYRSVMNDEPVLSTVAGFMGAGLRDFCSAPNGDFIAWFPDYFGHFKQAGKMVVTPLEINATDGPPTIGWSDENLKTHQFVMGSTDPTSADAQSTLRMATTAGVASIEFPELMMALLNISREEAETMRDTYLERYGARVEVSYMNNISGARQEFFFACHKFMQNWSQQFQASVNLTFMPELYPGMLLCLPMYGMQGYIVQTTDSWDMRSGSFTTNVVCAPWSSIGKSDKETAEGLPIGAPL